jgi:ribosomal protein S18 acetylase RimI-like enzyme
MAPRAGVEPATFRLGGGRSIQLSYRGFYCSACSGHFHRTNAIEQGNGGDEESRTPDLCIANAALSQLSYGPTKGRYVTTRSHHLQCSRMTSGNAQGILDCLCQWGDPDMKIQIRAANPEDCETIADFNAAIAMETEHKSLPPEVLRRGVLRLLKDSGRGRYYLAECDGQVIGQIMYTKEWSDWRDGWFWWIQSVYVDEDFRGQSVFSSLYRHLESLAQADPDVCGIRLYVDCDNHIAQSVYLALGMTKSSYRVMEVLVDREVN